MRLSEGGLRLLAFNSIVVVVAVAGIVGIGVVLLSAAWSRDSKPDAWHAKIQ